MTAAQLGALTHNPALAAYVAYARGIGVGCVAGAVLSLLVAVFMVYRATTTPGDAFGDHTGAWSLAVVAVVAASVLLIIGLPRLVVPEGFALHAMACAVYGCRRLVGGAAG